MIARFADPSTRQIALRVVRHAVFLRRATGIGAILEYLRKRERRGGRSASVDQPLCAGS
jgi:hypothetical protein